jgi:hypothetical protein
MIAAAFQILADERRNFAFGQKPMISCPFTRKASSRNRHKAGGFCRDEFIQSMWKSDVDEELANFSRCRKTVAGLANPVYVVFREIEGKRSQTCFDGHGRPAPNVDRPIKLKSAEKKQENLVTDLMVADGTHTSDLLASRLVASGLNVLGVVSEAKRTLAVIGNAGSSIWPHFIAWRKMQPEDLVDPLDTWSKSVITPIAEQLGGRAVFPSDRPYLPFQQWATRATGMKQSPLGILIHPVYGLWHAFRGAITFGAETLIQEPETLSHPCDLCDGKPCLSACPVNAFSKAGYDVAACRSHLASGAGEPCMRGGCLARRACPVGQEYAYTKEQMQFHMREFAV